MLKKFKIIQISLILFPIITFFLGYNSYKVIAWNYDIFYLHSSLLIILAFVLLIFNKIVMLKVTSKHFELLCIAIISCFVLGLVLITIHENLLYTRWLDLGLFPSNDAVDYVQQASKYLLEDKFYSDKGRIIFPIVYAGLLAEFDLNVKTVQLFITFFTAIITFLCSSLIHQKYGFFCSIIFASLSTDFLIEHVGGASTENLGYILGGIAFIFYFKFINIKSNKLINFIIFFLFLILGYLIRPSIPFILPILCIWAFIFIRKYSIIESYKLVLASIISLLFIIVTNQILLENKAPNTAKEFGNVYDSWYATHELGKYYLNDKYDSLPGTLWTKIFKDYPNIKNLKGNESIKAKRNIIINTFILNPENYVVGSFLQIYNFFNKSKIYIERFDHSSGFLFIEFNYYRIIILTLFVIGGVLSLILFLKYRVKYYLLIFLIFLATLLSQPLIFGGEARTIATVIFFVNLVIIFAINTLNKNIFNNKQNSANEKINFENVYSLNFLSILSFLTFLFFFFIFLKAYNNNYTYLKKKEFQLDLICKEGAALNPIIFNSNSGFFVNTYQKELKAKYKDFSKILDLYSDKSVILKKIGLDNTFSMSKEEINKRNSFRILDSLIKIHNGRIFQLSEREKLLYNTLTTQFLTEEAFYIKPINYKNKTLDEIILIKHDLVKEGLNTIVICK
ncbi:MAG: hypothetical protein CMJ06_00870 [Pelagibacterales bacterium]|nr:hypothetical protein [Pelagibacterales bacterium]OUU63419.1 MAG: hypothetical protein CBC22_00840 [Alphaproteobacteria bacterium TMED62]|tara:strand:- start:2728 stop:4764 length:2037 start_codon:yes stop_codon:yes gene_type:complete